MRQVRMKVAPGAIVHHRDPSTTGPRHVGWRELKAGDVLKTDPAEAERLERDGTATVLKWWER